MVRTNPILLVKITYLLFFFSILSFSPLLSSLAQDGEATDVRVTHGPLLGRPGPDTMSLWVRTEKAGKVTVFYGTKKDRLDKQASLVTTDLAKDRTGIITLQKLTSNTRYYYRIAARFRTRLTSGIPTATRMDSSTSNSNLPVETTKMVTVIVLAPRFPFLTH